MISLLARFKTQAAISWWDSDARSRALLYLLTVLKIITPVKVGMVGDSCRSSTKTHILVRDNNVKEGKRNTNIKYIIK